MRFPFVVGFCLHFAFCSCHAFSYHVIMCISFCICVHLMHPSILPVVRFAIRHSYVHRRTTFVSFHERVLNILRMDRDLPSGLGTPPVDRMSNFVSFGVRLILQRLTGELCRPRVCCSPTPLQNGPITHPNHPHVLHRRIMIMWAKITLHLDTPTSS